MVKRLLLAEEVAPILRVNIQRVYELVRTDRIPFLRLGERQYRFSPLALRRWLDLDEEQFEALLASTEEVANDTNS